MTLHLVALVDPPVPDPTPDAWTVRIPRPTPARVGALLHWLVTVALVIAALHGPTPTPTPTPIPIPAPPVPAPAPKPAPVAGTLHVSLVVDLDALTPAVASLREGLAIRAAMRGLDAVYRTYAATSPELHRLNLAKNVAAAGTPTLIVQTTDGRVILAERAPPDEAALIARIRSLRGPP